MLTISDTGVLDFSLSQKENCPPILSIIKPKALPHLATISLGNLFEGHLSHISTQGLFNTLEYTMPFPPPPPSEPKPIMFGHPDKPASFLEDTEHLLHFNRQNRTTELSHIIHGKRSIQMSGEIWSSQMIKRCNIKANIHASWVFENEMMLDLMPHIGPHLDTYTPIIGFDKTEDIDIKGPFEGGVYIKKMRHKGPFYQRLVDRVPIEESMTYTVDYGADESMDLSFHIPSPHGMTFLDTPLGLLWQAHIERMVRRADLLQSRCAIVKIKTPFLDVTLDDNIVMNGRSWKVIAYDIKPLVATVTLGGMSPLNEVCKNEIQRQYLNTDKTLVVCVKNDALTQEGFMVEHVSSIKNIPKTKIEVMF